MNYDDMAERLKDYGVSLSRHTLFLHNKLGLLPKPEKRHGGRGRGWQIDFSERALFETVANWRTMGLYRLTYKQLAEVRQRALGADSRDQGEMEAYWSMQVIEAARGRVLPLQRPQKLGPDERGPFAL